MRAGNSYISEYGMYRFQAIPPITHRHRQAAHQEKIQQTVTNPTVKVLARQRVKRPLIEEISSHAINNVCPQKEPSMQQPNKHPLIEEVSTCMSRNDHPFGKPHIPLPGRAAREQMSNIGHIEIPNLSTQDCLPCHSSNPATASRPSLPSTTTCHSLNPTTASRPCLPSTTTCSGDFLELASLLKLHQSTQMGCKEMQHSSTNY